VEAEARVSIALQPVHCPGLVDEDSIHPRLGDAAGERGGPSPSGLASPRFIASSILGASGGRLEHP
jgi:hypothetical protein